MLIPTAFLRKFVPHHAVYDHLVSLSTLAGYKNPGQLAKATRKELYAKHQLEQLADKHASFAKLNEYLESSMNSGLTEIEASHLIKYLNDSKTFTEATEHSQVFKIATNRKNYNKGKKNIIELYKTASDIMPELNEKIRKVAIRPNGEEFLEDYLPSIILLLNSKKFNEPSMVEVLEKAEELLKFPGTRKEQFANFCANLNLAKIVIKGKSTDFTEEFAQAASEAAAGHVKTIKERTNPTLTSFPSAGPGGTFVGQRTRPGQVALSTQKPAVGAEIADRDREFTAQDIGRQLRAKKPPKKEGWIARITRNIFDRL